MVSVLSGKRGKEAARDLMKEQGMGFLALRRLKRYI